MYNPSYPFIKPFIRGITPFISSRGPSRRNQGSHFQRIKFCLNIDG